MRATEPGEAGVTLYSEPHFQGMRRHLGDTGLTAYGLAALGLDRIASVRVSPADVSRDGTPGQILFRALLYDCAPVYLPTGEEAREHRLEVTADLPDTGDWATRARYVTVASSPATDADWGFSRVLAGGEPARYTLVEQPPAPGP